MLKRLNHIAIVVPDLEQAATFYRDILKASVSEMVDLPEHGVTTIFVDLGNTKIELLHPLGEKSPVSGFLKKKPLGGIHHFCIEVDDVFAVQHTLRKKGVRVLDDPKPGAHGTNVIFLHPADCLGCLVELEDGKG